MKKLLPFIIFIGVICLSQTSCHHDRNAQYKGTAYDLPQIEERGKLVALTLYGAGSYFYYRGQPMGYQYELCKQFADSLGLNLQIDVSRSIQEMINRLQNGKGDLIAYNLAINMARKDCLLFCGKEMISHQVIVQRNNTKKTLIKDVTELIGKEVYVKPGKYYERLVNLNNELGGGIQIHLVKNDSISIEELIARVAEGDIDYTVADNEQALLNKTYYPNLNIKLSISFNQRASWAVRKDCPLLANAVNEWYKANQSSPSFIASGKRYFETNKSVQHSSILSIEEGKISHYDELFKKYAPTIGWDWRLLAAVAYTESNFDTTAVSWAGAKGLMQLMPSTARAMGIKQGKEQNPEESVKAAVKYIGKISRGFRSVPDALERTKFVLASYNAGIGHVYDAMALAQKYGKDRTIWTNSVDNFILLKANEEYYTDSVCRNGYFRGVETYNFVRNIMARYDRYQKHIKTD